MLGSGSRSSVCPSLWWALCQSHPDPGSRSNTDSPLSEVRPQARCGQVEQTRWADLHERLLKKKKKKTCCWSHGPASLCSHWSGPGSLPHKASSDLSLSPEMGLRALLWLPVLPTPSPGLSLCPVGARCCQASRLLELFLTISHAVS